MEAAPRVGVVGAGQLALMLVEAGRNLGLDPRVLAESSTDPAARFPGAAVTIGSRRDRAVLARFLSGLDFVAFDQELVAGMPLTLALADAIGAGHSPTLVPSVDAMRACSDKLEQKRRLASAGLATPAWIAWRAGQEPLDAWLPLVREKFPRGAALKLAQGGYDGRGVFMAKDWSPEVVAGAREFCERAERSQSPVYAEPFVSFAHELAVVSTRWRDGRLVQYPVALTRQEDGICVEVRGPAEKVGVSAKAATAALKVAAKVGDLFGLVGTFAVELFLLEGDRVEINEIAPRVHNSGHFTLDGARTSQFENHWRAALDLPPGDAGTQPFWGMVNVLGRAPVDFGRKPRLSLQAPGCFAFWYNKQEARPGRKLGHVNVVAGSLAELDARFAGVSAEIARWQDSLEEDN